MNNLCIHCYEQPASEQFNNAFCVECANALGNEWESERANHQRIGQTVLILYGEHQNTLGKVYAYLPGREHPWLVRPESWPGDIPGIAYTSEELVFGCPKATVRVPCEACGVLFEPEHGYYEVDKPEQHIIGYSYCAGCCNW